MLDVVVLDLLVEVALDDRVARLLHPGGDRTALRGLGDGVHAKAGELDLRLVERVLRRLELLLERAGEVDELSLLERGSDAHVLACPGVQDRGCQLRVGVLEGQPEEVALGLSLRPQPVHELRRHFARRGDREPHLSGSSAVEEPGRREPLEAQPAADGIGGHPGIDGYTTGQGEERPALIRLVDDEFVMARDELVGQGELPEQRCIVRVIVRFEVEPELAHHRIGHCSTLQQLRPVVGSQQPR